jgi:PAS domain S-box-containing protein
VLIRATNWSNTPLGPITSWPQSLKTIVDFLMASQLGMNLLWGPQRVQIYNAANHPFMGSKHPRAFGRPAREDWGEVWDLAEPIHRRVFAGETVTLENQPWTLIRNSHPEETFFTSYFTPIRNETGKVAGVLVTAFETTETVKDAAQRDRAEQTLRQSKTRLSDVLEGIGEAFYAVDIDFRFLHVSRKALEIWDKKATDLIGRPFLDVFPHAAGSRGYEAHLRVLKSGKAEHFELVSPPVGRWFEVDIYPTSSGLSVAFRDIERRKLAESALRLSETRLKAAIDLVGLSPYSWDPKTDTLHWDGRLKTMWGLPPDAPIDTATALGAIHPEDQARVARVFEASLDPRGDGAYGVEYRVIGIRDGIERWVSTHAQTFFENGVPVDFIGAILDITERKRGEQMLRESEAKLRHLNETLEQQIANRTSELTTLQTELFQATRLSAAGQMATQLAHEIKQPLTAAANNVGAMRLLLRGEIKADLLLQIADEAIGDIHTASTIINRIREFVGRSKGPRRSEELAKIIYDAKALILAPSRQAPIEFRCRIDPNASTVFVDRIPITQVLVNLFRNAVEAMTSRHRREIWVTTAFRPPAMVEVSIGDSGGGVAPEMTHRLFEPLQSTKPEGLGVGLSICRSIIEAHGGEIWWTSKHHRGAVFSFTLPTQ